MKTLLITGGTGGLGTVVVERLAREYHCLLLTRHDADLTDSSSVDAAISRLVTGPLYGVVHLAGGFAPGMIAETTDATWSGMLTLNATAAFHLFRAVLPKLERPGRIVAVSSIATIDKQKGAAAYTVSKAALNALIETLAAELAGSGATANAILPATLATPAMRAAMPGAALVSLESVAATIAFLLSDSAAHVNGALIPLHA